MERLLQAGEEEMGERQSWLVRAGHKQIKEGSREDPSGALG